MQPVSYSQLARSIHELAAASDQVPLCKCYNQFLRGLLIHALVFTYIYLQKSSQRQLVHQVFPKLAVYNSVDPSLAPSLLMVFFILLFFLHTIVTPSYWYDIVIFKQKSQNNFGVPCTTYKLCSHWLFVFKICKGRDCSSSLVHLSTSC